jgi:predicted permease
MRTLRGWIVRLRGLFSRRRDEQDFAAQLEADLALAIDQRIQEGATPDEARRAAALEFGSRTSVTEAWRDRHGLPFLERFHRDVTFALRLLRHNPGWATVGMLSLALGVGAGAAVFSAAATLLVQQLPIPHPRDLVVLRWQGENKALTNFNDYGYVEDGIVPSFLDGQFDFEHMRAGGTLPYEAFKRMQAARPPLAMFAFAPGPSVNLIVDGHGDVAGTQYVSGNFFSGLQVPAAAGRELSVSDDRAGAERVAVISHEYWLRRFNGAASIVGKQVRINASTFTIVGVAGDMPSMLYSQSSAPEISLPLSTEPTFQAGSSRLEQATSWWLVVMGRLAPSHTATQVEAALAPVFDNAVRDGAARFLATLPPSDVEEAKAFKFGQRIPRLHLVSAARGAYDPLPLLRAPLTILAALAVILLLIVCANMTNLSMALTAQRERELSMRCALGATRGRVTRQILTEHVVLAMVGGALSCVAAYLFQHTMRVFLPTAFDWRVIAFAFVLAMISGLVIGILPAISTWRAFSKHGGAFPGRRTRLAGGLLVGQVAMSLVLLVGSGLFLRTLSNLQHVDPGFDSANLVTFTLDPSTNQYDAARASALVDDARARLAALPGVSAVTFASQPLLRNSWNSTDLYAEGTTGTTPQRAYSLAVQDDFFRTLGIRLIAGRSFTSRDTANAPPVAVLNATLAKRLFGSENAVGRRFGNDPDKRGKFEVIGVVADTRPVTLRAESPMAVYWPHTQSPDGPRTFFVKSTSSPEAMMPAIRRVMGGIDPAVPLVGLSTQASAFEDQWSRERTTAIASTTLGILALAVSMIGLFGLASYRVTRRTREIAIRMAVGAEAPGVLRGVLRESLGLVGLGLLLGVVMSLAMTRAVRTQLFGLAPNDPLVITAAVVTLFGVAILASYLPAHRAAHIDPMATLRED